MNYDHSELKPRNGRALQVLGICRISTVNQDKLSLRDQKDLLTKQARDYFQGPTEFEFISTQGSGEHLDRAEVQQARQLVARRRFDLVIMEDLGRFVRGPEAYSFCGLCVDFDTRLIAINDGIDTARDWQESAVFAAARHGRYNEDTSRRIKQRMGNRFLREGGVVQFLIYGYTKPSDATTDDKMEKDPAAVAVYEKWFSLLEGGATYAEVADWLNAEHVPVGPYCDLLQWDGAMVSRVTQNPLLKGLRVRNQKNTVKHHQSGHRKSVKCHEPKVRQCPHLAFIEPVRYDRLMDTLKQRNSKHRRNPVNGVDPIAGKPKRRTN